MTGSAKQSSAEEGSLDCVVALSLAMTATDVPANYPRPTNGILLAITVMNSTLASSGRPAM
jgi:hypothetical protein